MPVSRLKSVNGKRQLTGVTLEDLVVDPALVNRHRNGSFVTLRLTSGMYHRFHAPDDADVNEVIHITGDTWNVNPIALKRIARTGDVPPPPNVASRSLAGLDRVQTR